MTAKTHNAYAPGHSPDQVKHHEWRTAENSAAHLIPHLQRLSSADPGLQLLDVGAGSGTITASLARYIPGGHITATDISDEILDKAKQHALSEGLLDDEPRLSFQRADVYSLPFEDASFDVTHAHQVLCHLDDPVLAVGEMLRVTRPGGVVALRETDMHMFAFWPELPGLLRFHELQVSTLLANGGQDKGGRRLVRWALEAGARREHVDAGFGTWCYSAPEDREAWGQIRTKAIDMGLATETQLGDMVVAWETWRDTDEATLDSPFLRASKVCSSISALAPHSSITCSARPGGTTTTPSLSPTSTSPGLIHRSSLNWTATLISEALVKVLLPRMDVPLANTGNPISWCSPTSLTRPSTTTPAAPRYLARVDMSPPQQAEYISRGCWMYMTLPASLQSAKCSAGLGEAVSLAGTILTVTAGPRILVVPVRCSGDHIESPSRKPP
ncbi:ubiE/COQ5 methyltransferase family [Geosmithia morbida]|uniref:UbiE/COQ5 methyltransferase family n=1 Tax=Geosmithia morbida TaxID=1094350 RepID=A0A9P4YYX8_9HYPO|nr:ubiE/COQ5 methyltransferase family [Geosmithia morbida]KAF4124316.1 ubiE/COQ5 methyltransferase family [Geosmithia morbida]